MTDKIELLPLPEDYVDDEGLWEKRYGPYSPEQMEDYARANVARAVEPLQAEIEALIDEATQHLRQAMSNGRKARAAYAEIEKLRTERDALARENEAMKRCAIKYLGWLGITHMPLDEALRKDMSDPTMCGDAAIAAANGGGDALEQDKCGTQQTINVVGMPEFDSLLDHIYEYGTGAEGVVERANAFARAVIARYMPQQSAVVDDAMVERACRHWYIQLWDTADQATKRLWAKAMYDLLTAALQQRQPTVVDGRRKGMEEITKKTVITETTRLELTEEQIANALLEHFGMVGGEVSFDVSSSGFLRGAQIELTRVSGSTE